MPNDTTVVIAGPGAGKTHNMVEKVLSALNDLKANKFCCVITYTNAATEVIRSRISAKIDIPPNLFIGTIHSFLNHFYINPYFHLFIDEIIGSDDYDHNCELVFRESIKKDWLKGDKKTASEFKTEKDLIKEGKICYRTSIYLAHKFSNNVKLNYIISKRIQFLYVDEYQDSDHFINEILKRLVKTNSIVSFFIGDPNQNIQTITSFPSNIRKKVKDAIEDFKKEDNIFTDSILENWRSSKEIVRFINNFQKINQVSMNQEVCFPVTFINESEINYIFKNFNIIILKGSFTPEKDTYCKVLLSNSWKDDAKKSKIKLLSKFKNKNDLIMVENDWILNTESVYKNFETCLISSVKKTKNDIINEKFSINIIEFRKFILKLIHKYTSKDCINGFKRKAYKDETIDIYSYYTNTIKKKFREELYLDDNPNAKKMTCDKLCKLYLDEFCNDTIEIHRKIFCSTIHKYKGLEATSILAISPSLSVLKKWIETDESQQNRTSREGFVAFSRARKLLCIACLEELDEPIKQKLRDLDVKFSDEILIS